MTEAPLKPGAIYCLNCEYYRNGEKHHQVLGSIDSWGRLIIKRVHNMNTVIIGAAVLTVSCDVCEYTTVVSIESPSQEQKDYAQTVQ